MDKKFEKLLGCLMAVAMVALPILDNIEATALSGEGLVDSSGLLNEHPGIMRFHVIANSDSDQDQDLKLAVRNYVLSKVENEITCDLAKAINEAGSSSEETGYLSEEVDAEMENQVDQAKVIRESIEENLPQIEDWANEVIRMYGFDYTATANLGIRHIPAKYYGELFFPEGNYEALTITLGEGAGQNWWCVVFPPLCLIDSENATYNEEFHVSEQDRLILKFKTEELLAGLDDEASAHLTCKASIYSALLPLLTAPTSYNQ